jgi:hypothetical protein
MTSDEFFVEPTVGVTDIVGLNSIKAYPNPSTGIVNILSNSKSGGLKTITLLNPIGEEILKVEAEKQLELSVDFSSQAKGVYLLRLEAEKESIIEKVILH